ncbi:hypothetical protein SUGI_0067530 [Cryptomeria japonica]|nr:hypothetical protein SUGI_0067530 [Cryptomeria japonica]
MDVGTEFLDRGHMKTIYDNVHHNIHLDSLSLKFVDTEQYQRLRDIKQLGLCYLVYPGAMHSRFEHSLGVYWLAGKAIEQIRRFQGSELDIERNDIMNVKLAGLLHDIGHGPFSHTFESSVLRRILPGSNWSHEQMSAKMIDYIVDEHYIDIDPTNLKRVKDMIIDSCKHSYRKDSSRKNFLFDIVANRRNGIDVDKFDYIERDTRACGINTSFQFERLMESMKVIDDEICYRAKECWCVSRLFLARSELYRIVYTHPKVKALELMLTDALVLANRHLSVSSQIDNPADYWKLDDSVLKTIETSPNEELKEARALVLRMRRRDLYRYCNEYPVPIEHLEHFKDVTPQDIICAQTNSGTNLKEDDIAVSNVKIDLSKGREDPIESVHFFEDYGSTSKFTIQKSQISQLLPASCQDTIVRVYAKKPELVGVVSDAFVNFQLKTYGIKTQIHGTPESKKNRRSSLNDSFNMHCKIGA